MGFVWAFIEPIMMVLVMYLIFSAMGSTIGGGIQIAVFMITGFVPFMISSATRCNSRKGQYRRIHIVAGFSTSYYLRSYTCKSIAGNLCAFVGICLDDDGRWHIGGRCAL